MTLIQLLLNVITSIKMQIIYSHKSINIQSLLSELIETYTNCLCFPNEYLDPIKTNTVVNKIKINTIPNANELSNQIFKKSRKVKLIELSLNIGIRP